MRTAVRRLRREALTRANSSRRRVRSHTGDEMKEAEENYALKLCPFCGGPAKMKMLAGRFAVVCENRCAGTRLLRSKKECADIWNKRA